MDYRKLQKMNSGVFPSKAADLSIKSFWHYTKAKSADAILESKCFRFSNILNMNDLHEINLHKGEEEKIFSICFCNSDTEKIPLWYLYSGIEGDGAALGFSPGVMLKWMKGMKSAIGIKKGSKDEVSLSIGNDIKLLFGWVYYLKDKTGNKIAVKYRNKYYDIQKAREKDFVKDNYFVKAYPWEYENEFRIILINQTNTDFERIDVTIPGEVCSRIKVRMGPEFRKRNGNNKLKCIGTSPYIPTESNLDIHMQIFERNKESMVEYIVNEIKSKSSKIDAEELRSIFKDEQAQISTAPDVAQVEKTT